MKSLKRIGRTLKRLYRDERGADMVEYVLVVAMIALPLLAVALIFRNELWEWVRNLWENIQSDGEVPN